MAFVDDSFGNLVGVLSRIAKAGTEAARCPYVNRSRKIVPFPFDDVLREVAKRLNGGVRSYDAVSRYGGEEFLVVLVGCPSQLAMSRAEHIRRLIDSRPFDTSAGALNVSMSLGVAGTDDWAGLTADSQEAPVAAA